MASARLAGPRRRRLALSLTDQVVSSGSNFLMLFLVIRMTNLAQVGAFSIVYSLFFLVLAIGRGLVGEPYTIRFVTLTDDRHESVLAMASGAALAFGGICGVICALTGVISHGPLQEALLCLAPMLPGLVLQDSWRLFCFATGRPGRAVMCDGALLLIQVTTYAALAGLGSLTLKGLILGWGFAAGGAAVLGCAQFRVVPRPSRAVSWFVRTAGLGPALAADYAVNRGAEQVTLVVLSSLGSLAAQGAISATRALFAPLTTLQTGLNAFALPEMARANQAGDPRRVARLSWGIGCVMSVLMLMAGAALLMLPDATGVRLFGGNWLPMQSIIVPMTAFSAMNALSFGLWLGVRSMGLARRSLQVRALGGILMIGLAAVGITISPSAAVWGMTLSTVPVLAMFALALRVRLSTETAIKLGASHSGPTGT